MEKTAFILKQDSEIVKAISRALVKKFGAKTDIAAEALCGRLCDLENTIDITPFLKH